jgi:hypothetical protein
MERSDDRLSTRDIASPSGADTEEPQRFERDDRERELNREAAFGDAPAADTERGERTDGTERTDRDFDDGGAVASDRAEPVGDGDVVTDEPTAGRGPSRDSIADDTASAPAAAAAAPPGAGTADTADRADATTERTDRDSSGNGNAPLLSDADGFQSRWEEIQVRFVDEPRGAVEDADALVATVMQRLAEGFAQERERLEGQWGRGEDISTEDLRVALQRYRSFFQRLLST